MNQARRRERVWSSHLEQHLWHGPLSCCEEAPKHKLVEQVFESIQAREHDQRGSRKACEVGLEPRRFSEG